MGLPILPADEEGHPGGHQDDAMEDDQEESIEDSVMAGLKDLRKAEEEKMRKTIVREWDVGKEGVSAAKATDQDEYKEQLKMTLERKVLSQDEWVSQKRQNRNNEFAPPSAYDHHQPKKAKMGVKNPNMKKYANVPPPPAGPNLQDFNPSMPPPSRPEQGKQRQQQQQQQKAKQQQPRLRPTVTEFDPDEPLPPGYVPPAPPQDDPYVEQQVCDPTPFQRPAAAFAPQRFQRPPPASTTTSSHNFQRPSAAFDTRSQNFQRPTAASATFSQRIPRSSDHGVSLDDRLYMHEQTYSPIINEVGGQPPHRPQQPQFVVPDQDEEDSGEEDSAEDDDAVPVERPKRTEIAPPTHMDYYISDKRPTERPKGFRTHDQMADAFLSGLKTNLKVNHEQDSDEDDSD
jgi:hypothetical protein